MLLSFVHHFHLLLLGSPGRFANVASASRLISLPPSRPTLPYTANAFVDGKTSHVLSVAILCIARVDLPTTTERIRGNC